MIMILVMVVMPEKLLGMDGFVQLYSVFLFPLLGLRPRPLENLVEEERDGCGVDDLQPMHPFRQGDVPAVR